jgi:hypothetical protein
MLIKILDPVYNAGWLLSGGSVVQPNKRLAVDLFGKYGEIVSHRARLRFTDPSMIGNEELPGRKREGGRI